MNPSRDDVIFSIKAFVAAMLAYWIALRFGMTKPYWAVGTAYIVSQPLAGASTSKAVYRLLGTLMGGAMTVLIVPNLVNEPMLMTLAVACWTGFCLFVSLLDRTPRSYMFMLSGYTVLLTSMSLVSTPEATFTTAVSRVEEIALGVICATLVNRLVLPRHAGPIMVARVDGWRANAAALARDTLSGAGDAARAIAERRRLAADAMDLRSFTTFVAYDTTGFRDRLVLLRTLQQRMITLLPILSAVQDQLQQLRAAGPLPADMAACLTAVGDHLERAGGPAADTAAEAALDAEGVALVARLNAAELAHHREGADWQGLIAGNLARRLAELVEVWLDCRALRHDLGLPEGREAAPSPRAARAMAGLAAAPLHRPYALSAIAGLSAVLTIIASVLPWIATAWPHGAAAAQVAGVFCCLMAAQDNPVPALKMFITWTFWAIVAATILQYVILPPLDGFLSIAAALGLLLIPAGVYMANPRTMAIGMGLCVNVPFMMTLQETLPTDFAAFLDNNIATMLALVCALVVSSLVRTLGAQAVAYRLMGQVWRRLAQAATPQGAGGPVERLTPDGIAHVRRYETPALTHRLVDTLGQLAPRLAMAPESPGTDVMRDLRVGLNIHELQHFRRGLSGSDALRLDALLAELARFYRGRRAAPHGAATGLAAPLEACLAADFATAPPGLRRELRAALAGLRLGLMPEAPPPARLGPPPGPGPEQGPEPEPEPGPEPEPEPGPQAAPPTDTTRPAAGQHTTPAPGGAPGQGKEGQAA